ncbi:SDR family NAD(P)-dependent oxidoreductase [Streptomyces sannanensis]|uniref:SDR family NAD(P)-dependent oxidoreductase n=1 Tax=Streptomyces sannanensis TaxID=285536 RepID=A0ABP6SKM9_9ACTN
MLDRHDTSSSRRKATPRASHARRVVLITGASSGIGAATAERLAAEGRWELLLNGRDETRLARVAADTAGTAIPGDLTEEGGCARLAEEAVRHSGRVDVLITAAGIGWAGPFATMPPDSIDPVLDTNLRAVLRLVREVLPGMVTRRRGHVVLIGSLVARLGVRGEAVYSASKGALVPFADSLRYELAGSGVHVSMVLPGVVDTPFFTTRGVPYHRDWPRPVAPQRVADAVCGVLRHHRDEVYVPTWLNLPVRVSGTVPSLFRRLATRFG